MEPAKPTGADVLPVVSRLLRLLRQTGTSDGLSPVASAVVGRLSRNGAERLSDLARSQGASQPGMTQLVGRLERDGLVSRAPDPYDGRGVLVEITQRGREALDRLESDYSAVLDALLGRLDEADRQAIGAALAALMRLAAAADEQTTPINQAAGPSTAGRQA
jgi:DNA-binding MarR family transcriptional regulator